MKRTAPKSATTVLDENLSRTISAPPVELKRTVSVNTVNNLTDLSEYLDRHAQSWAQGKKPGVKEVSVGHTLVYRICAESGSPADAEHKSYEMYLDYTRGVVQQYPAGAKREEALTFLRKVSPYSNPDLDLDLDLDLIFTHISQESLPLPRSALHKEEGDACTQGHDGEVESADE